MTFTFSCLSGFPLLTWGLWTAPLKTASSAMAETLGMLDNNLLTSLYVVRQCPMYLGHFCGLFVMILCLVSFSLVRLTKELLNHLISCIFSHDSIWMRSWCLYWVQSKDSHPQIRLKELHETVCRLQKTKMSQYLDYIFIYSGKVKKMKTQSWIKTFVL